MQEQIEPRLQECDVELFETCRESSTATISALDGQCFVVVGQGGLMGAGNAPEEFLSTYLPCLGDR